MDPNFEYCWFVLENGKVIDYINAPATRFPAPGDQLLLDPRFIPPICITREFKDKGFPTVHIQIARWLEDVIAQYRPGGRTREAVLVTRSIHGLTTAHSLSEIV